MTDKLTLTGEPLRDPQDSLASQVDQSEDRMRRALDQLGGGSGHSGRSRSSTDQFSGTRKHRFVQDGDVAVTHVQARRDRAPRAASAPEAGPSGARDAGLRDSLAEERMLRLRAERAAQEAQSTIAGLQTKLAHGEIALAEARRAAEVQAEAAAQLQAELQQRDQQIALLRERLDAAEAERQQLMQARQAEAAEPPESSSIVAKTLRTGSARKISRATRSVVQSQKALGPDADEPQPVKWWLAKKA